MNASQLFEQQTAEAEKGNADAQAYLGYCYFNGKGVPKNVGEAVKWFRKAAEQGNAYAQYNLGVCYSDNDGVPKIGDLFEAVQAIVSSGVSTLVGGSAGKNKDRKS